MLDLALGLGIGIALGLRFGGGVGSGAAALGVAGAAAAALVLGFPRVRAAASLAAGVAGWALGAAAAAGASADCRARLPDGATVVVRGVLEARPWPGAAAPLRARVLHVVRVGGEAEPEGAGAAPADASADPDPQGASPPRPALLCAGVIRAKLPEGEAALPAGVELSGVGKWWAQPPEGRWPRPPDRAGVLSLETVRLARSAGDGGGRGHPLLRARDHAQALTRELFGRGAPGGRGERRAAVAEALVLAQQSGIDDETRERFSEAGLVHILSIGGLHVGLIVAAVLLLARALKLPQRESSLVAVGAMLLYVVLIGAPVPALRSAVQLALILAARLLQRPTDPRAPVAAAALLILVLWPFQVLDAGFQLSFAGVLGLLTLRRPLMGHLAFLHPAWLCDSVATSIAATLATTPIAVAQFGLAAPVGILSNLVAVPLAAPIVPAIGLSLLVGSLAPALGAFLAGGTGLLLDALDLVARAAAAIPGGHALVPADQAVAWTVAALAAGLVAAASARQPEAGARPGRPQRRRLRPRTMALGTAAALLLLWPVALRMAGAGSMDIWAIDVGQGDALAIRSPAGRWLLVDAGPRDQRFDAGKARVVPFLLAHGVGRLEALVLTHPDADHIGGAPAVLDAMPVAEVLEPGVPAGRPLYLEALRTARRRGTRWLAARDGRELRLDGMLLRVLSPRPESLDGAVEVNEVSVVFSLEYGSFRALFMGDAPTDAEAALVAAHAPALMRAALIKVGHHGSATSTGEALLDAVAPRGALISVGRHNRFGHPTPATLRRLARRGVRVWRTDVAGTLHVRAVAAGGWRVETAR